MGRPEVAGDSGGLVGDVKRRSNATDAGRSGHLRSATLSIPQLGGIVSAMAQFVYIDETGSIGTMTSRQPYLTLVAVLVDEERVKPLGEALQFLAMNHLGWIPAGFEFHGHEVWGGDGWWHSKSPPELISAYEAVVNLLIQLELEVVHSSINKAKLHERYDGDADKNAYRLGLQFLLEKVDRLGQLNRIVVADETKEQELSSIQMVADMQKWGGGEVPGRTLETVIDSLHFVRSDASPGVQMADMTAFVIQRSRRDREEHPDALAAIRRIRGVVDSRTMRWREPWPS